MIGIHDPQVGPAMALVQFLAEHPVRPETVWSVDGPELRGVVYGPQAGDWQAVDWYAEVLDAEPVRKHSFEYGGRQLRVVEVAAVWRDVTIVIQVSVKSSLVTPTEIRPGGMVLAPADVAVAS